ncbi:UDP-N-acetylmuramoyl-tripeptide--D-alanyl-D-alanine ligase [Marinobacterium sp. LSUCC0821]|uniref:UDP-N-acetylmuramoyl-tripeptide--D-alanyl-D- alanine ligase n=1 Tax=Marinobacterium sp. LSUCC0821 TaxID=2668067 RepID=UPI001B7D0210|nr:UDP-N-acetylmuramoyl-tripeptide--D-alanyl-D-alanine ligase [Marinobacterium sp. LSUCC0821]
MIRTFSLNELADFIGAELVGSDQQVDRVITDSRIAKEGDLFVALKGERFDAHQFVDQVVSSGVKAVVVSARSSTSASQLVVTDTRAALAKLGQFNRSLFAGNVVAVTGSAGKTSVKEMLAVMFGGLGETLATQGNLNNDIGAPLTLLDITPAHQYAVIELGASAVGEIAHTVSATQPQVAILNNALEAHLDGFGSLENIVQAKSEIFEGLVEGGTGVVNADSPFAEIWLKKLSELNRDAVTFAIDADADLKASILSANAAGCFGFDLAVDGQIYPISLNVMGRHMVANALAALAAWYALELPIEKGIAAVETYRGFKGRLQVHQLSNGVRLIDDSYNANPSSMRAAIDALKNLKGATLLVLGDMAELGAKEKALHAQIGAYAAAHGVSSLYAVGRLMAYAVDAFGIGANHYDSQEELIRALLADIPPNSAILVKGSRSAAMDRVVTALLNMEETAC